jgi:CO/xanthine dehydrogenase FAD-binding subunit
LPLAWPRRVVQAALARACGEAASPQIRNVDTVGGNLLLRPRCPRRESSYNRRQRLIMSSAKQVARDLLDRLPEDCSLQEIQYHLCVREMIEEGRREVREGRYFTQEQMERDLAEWLER